MNRISLLFLGLLLTASASPVRTLDVGRNPESVTRGFGGDLFVSIMGQRGAHPDAATDGAVHRVDRDGKVTVFCTGGMAEPKGIVFTGESLVTADIKNVWRIDSTGQKTLLAGPAAFPEPPVYLNDVALDPLNRGVYVTDMNNQGEIVGPNGLNPVDDPGILARKPHGRVYHVAWDGKVTLAIGDSPLMPYPNGVFVEPDGRIIVGEFFLGTIVAGYPGQPLKVVASGHRSVDGVETDNHGNLYVSEVFTGKIWQLPPAGKEPVLLHQSQSAADYYLDRSAHELIVADSRAGQLVFIKL